MQFDANNRSNRKISEQNGDLIDKMNEQSPLQLTIARSNWRLQLSIWWIAFCVAALWPSTLMSELYWAYNRQSHVMWAVHSLCVRAHFELVCFLFLLSLVLLLLLAFVCCCCLLLLSHSNICAMAQVRMPNEIFNVSWPRCVLDQNEDMIWWNCSLNGCKI